MFLRKRIPFARKEQARGIQIAGTSDYYAVVIISLKHRGSQQEAYLLKKVLLVLVEVAVPQPF